jgi:V/A-type H+-transporting ATPase subunit I
MIVPMKKVFLACSAAEHDRLLDALHNLGVVHLIPVEANKAVADEKTLQQLDALHRATMILAVLKPAGQSPDISPVQAADETLNLQRQGMEQQSRLNVLYRQHEQLELWGDVRMEQFEKLRQAGIEVSFYSVPVADADQVRAEAVQTLRELHGKRVLVAVVKRGEAQPTLPDSAQPLDLPSRDRPSLLAEAAQVDQALKDGSRRLHELANLLPAIRDEYNRFQTQAQYTVAQRGALSAEALFAVQGWAPADEAPKLAEHLSQRGVHAAVEILDPSQDDEPPTLVRYPAWARPIQALFKVLGTVPGYREQDLAPFFMLALPIFTAMLIGDTCYGLVFLLVGGLGYKKLAAKAGKTAPQLILVLGLATLIWGVLTGSYFGVAPADMQNAGVPFRWLGNALQPLALLWRADSDASRLIVIQISFLLAVVHLVTAHFLQVIGCWPNQKAWAELGWCVFLTGMFGVVWLMFSPAPLIPITVIFGLLSAGGALIVLFSFPSRNPFKRLGLGFIANVMPAINTFGDTISYIRLMAVGMAGYYIALAFNGLGYGVLKAHPAFILPALLIFLAAHSMNIILCLIAIFAHGVRLNMLEFSSNSGVQWVGHPYAPFGRCAANPEGE